MTVNEPEKRRELIPVASVNRKKMEMRPGNLDLLKQRNNQFSSEHSFKVNYHKEARIEGIHVCTTRSPKLVILLFSTSYVSKIMA